MNYRLKRLRSNERINPRSIPLIIRPKLDPSDIKLVGRYTMHQAPAEAPIPSTEAGMLSRLQ